MDRLADTRKRQCTLLLFVATSTEEDALGRAAAARTITFEKMKDAQLGRYGWGNITGWGQSDPKP